MARSVALKLLLALASLLALERPAAGAMLQVGDVSWSDDGTTAVLENSAVSRTWQMTATPTGKSVATIELRRIGGPNLVGSPANEFTLGLGGLTVDSSQFRLASLDAADLANGIKATFVFEPLVALGLPIGVKIVREVTLYSSVGVFEVTTTLRNSSPLPLLLSSYSLDEIHPSVAAASAEVQAYVGGSDWRDDFRHVKPQAGQFDDEGEVVRFDDGVGGGWFFVSERRGGAASRVGRDASRAWAGADFARDLLDLGPLATTPPNYNRLENPLYPVPVRARHVLPLSDFRLGRVATGVYQGGAEQAAAAYVSYLTRYRQPPFPRQVLLNSFHPWSHGPEFNSTTMEKQADIAATLGIDTIILDDQWQGGAGGESGDWQWDTARFPDLNGDGKGDIADYFASKGVKLGLWMSPAEFNGASKTFAAHPLWACTPIGTLTSQVPDDAGLGVWDFTNPELRAYMSGVIDRIVGDWGVSYFKFDFQAWVDCPPHDYNDYEEAFADWVDSLKKDHPNVTFTFDETNDQRMYAFESVARGPSWFDNAHSHQLPDGSKVAAPAQILHDVWMAAPWIPPSTLGVGLFDSGTLKAGYSAPYLLSMAALIHMTFWTDLTQLTLAERSETAWWLGWYHLHAAELGGLVYRLTDEDPWDGAAPVTFQPWDPAADRGYLFAFRQNGGAPVAKLQGLVPGHSYQLTNVRDSSVLGPITAVELTSGIVVPLDSNYSAAVYTVTPQ